MEYYTTIDELLNSISDVLLRVLLIVQQLLQENRHGSKRDIYYMHPSVFSGKSELSFSPNFKWYFFLYSSFPITVIGIWKMHVQWNKFEYLPLIYTCAITYQKKKLYFVQSLYVKESHKLHHGENFMGDNLISLTVLRSPFVNIVSYFKGHKSALRYFGEIWT